MGDFLEQSVAHGFNRYEFLHLSEEDRTRIVLLLARISEQSFRRGFQQGCYMQQNNIVAVDPSHWRLVAPIDDSPDPDSKSGSFISIKDRLYGKYGVLTDLGLPDAP